MIEIVPPFSNRNRGAHVQIDSDFPESARTGLLHLLHDLRPRSGGAGVAHGGTTGGEVSQDLAEYILAVAASQIILLVDLASSEEANVPF